MTSTKASSPAAGLRFLLDTADRGAWAEWLPLGFFHGVTTNPVLLEAAGLPCAIPALETLARTAFDLGAGEIHMQTWGRTRDRYADHGRALAAIDGRVVVKAPTTVEGVAAAARLKGDGVRLTMTAVYSAAQTLVASALGADYAAPYLGRMNDAGHDGFGEIAGMARAARAHGSTMRILVASLRDPGDVVRLAEQGLDTFTFSPKVAAAFFADDLARQAVEAFEVAAESR
ncbi:transaldolase [Roseiarcus fermentans]|uniref:Transaldolase n=1 Tax=Roseiarcus fermentans TaxID=1473586 RepID=A0A366FP97_9HYPH|nr:transaldolase family protein [Roseiarcus fermentans]RBP15539.1 transaldolase [Roseiarcus fermentans]